MVSNSEILKDKEAKLELAISKITQYLLQTRPNTTETTSQQGTRRKRKQKQNNGGDYEASGGDSDGGKGTNEGNDDDAGSNEDVKPSQLDDLNSSSYGEYDVVDTIQKELIEFDKRGESYQTSKDNRLNDEKGSDTSIIAQQSPSSTSSIKCQHPFFDAEILKGHSNYTYKLTVRQDRNNDNVKRLNGLEGSPAVVKNSVSSSMTGSSQDLSGSGNGTAITTKQSSLFVKVALSYALWNPDRSAKFDLQRLSNEMYMMMYVRFVLYRLHKLKKQQQQQRRQLPNGTTIATNVKDDPVYCYLLDVDEFDFGSASTERSGKANVDINTEATGETNRTSGTEVDHIFLPSCQPYFILDLDETARCLVNHFEADNITWHAYFVNYSHRTDKIKMQRMLKSVAKFIALINLQPISSSSPIEPMEGTAEGDPEKQNLQFGPFHPNFNDGVRETFLKVGPVFKALFQAVISDRSSTTPPELPDGRTTVPSLFTSNDRTTNSDTMVTPYNHHFIEYARTMEANQESFSDLVDRMMESYLNRSVVLHGDVHVVNILVPVMAQLDSSGNVDQSPSIFRLCDWDMAHVGDYGRDVGSFFAFPVASAYFLACQPGRKQDAYALVDHLSLVWNEYSRIMTIQHNIINNKKQETLNSPETDKKFESVDEYLSTVYRSAMGWFGVYSLCANVLLNLQMDLFAFDRVSEEMGVMVMSSYSLTGLKAMRVGFSPATPKKENSTSVDGLSNLSSLTKWFHDTVSDQVEFLATKAAAAAAASE